jgi:hypothetical protein
MKLQFTKEEQLAADVEQVVALAAEIELARPAVARLRKLLEVLDDPFARGDAADDAMPAPRGRRADRRRCAVAVHLPGDGQELTPSLRTAAQVVPGHWPRTPRSSGDEDRREQGGCWCQKWCQSSDFVFGVICLQNSCSAN